MVMHCMLLLLLCMLLLLMCMLLLLLLIVGRHAPSVHLLLRHRGELPSRPSTAHSLLVTTSCSSCIPMLRQTPPAMVPL